MADGTKIEWTEASWTPIRARVQHSGRIGWHCVHASEGCRNCYAEGMNRRLGTGLDYKPGHERLLDIFLDEKMLTQPLRWRRPRMIFVCSMTDLFADFVTDEWIDRIFAVMALCPQHTFQVLTKRPERMRGYFNGPFSGDGVMARIADATWALAHRTDLPEPPTVIEVPIGQRLSSGEPEFGWRRYLKPAPLPNVWIGTSVEDQETADARIPELLATPAAVRWISAEPLLAAVDLRWIAQPDMERSGVIDALAGKDWIVGGGCGEAFRPYRPGHQDRLMMRTFEADCTRLDWVVVGGESGPRARPMHPDWARSLRDQCQAAGVAFFFKQWGEWGPDVGPEEIDGDRIVCDRIMEGRARCAWWNDRGWTIETDGYAVDLAAAADSGEWVYRLGKKAAGRLLDGVEWNQFPEVLP